MGGHTVCPLNSAEKTRTHSYLFKGLFLPYSLKQRNGLAPPPAQSFIFKEWEAEVVAWGAGWYEVKCGSSFYPLSLQSLLTFSVPFPKL